MRIRLPSAAQEGSSDSSRQPFHVAENFTGVKGAYVKMEDTIRGFQAILGGECDDLPEQAFLMCGTIDEVLAKRDQFR